MNKIFSTIFGSKLYGTNTPTSDEDYKGVYIASFEDIILGRDKATIHEDTKVTSGERNSAGDVDMEWIELRRFISDALGGQTYALDMLFATERTTLITSDIWKFIQKNRSRLISKNINPYLGYIRRQVSKYGLKGTRLGEVLRFKEYLEKQHPKKSLAQVLEEEPFEFSEFVSRVTKDHTFPNKVVQEDFVKVLESYHPVKRFVGEVLASCEALCNRYGARAVLAKENEGIDFKAVHHAYRACYQLIELAETGSIIYPLTQADRLREIKQGKVPYSIVQEELPLLMMEAEEKVSHSQFIVDEQPKEFWDEWLVRVYRTI